MLGKVCASAAWRSNKKQQFRELLKAQPARLQSRENVKPIHNDFVPACNACITWSGKSKIPASWNSALWMWYVPDIAH
jgi:hypothetical protein